MLLFILGVLFMENIRIMREKKGLKQRGLANLVGVAPSSIANYEAGIRDPSLPVLCRIADALDCSLDVLVRGKEKDRPFGRSKDELMKMFSELSEEEHLWMIALLQASLADIRFQAHLRQEHQEEP